MVDVVNARDNTLSVIDGKTNKEIANITVGTGNSPTAISVNPSTDWVYVANSGWVCVM